jgi:hypothetical protein
MRPLRSLAILAAAAAALAGCSAYDGYYAPNAQATYSPARTAYYGTPAPVVAYPAPAYAYDPPNYQRSNVYASRWDYYRNYQGIHGGPERTGP